MSQQKDPLFTGDQPRIAPEQHRHLVRLDVDDWLDKGYFAQVKSSNVAAIAYEKTLLELSVEFLNGSLYVYTGVPRQKAWAMFNASSVGTFLHQQIKGKHSFRKVR